MAVPAQGLDAVGIRHWVVYRAPPVDGRPPTIILLLGDLEEQRAFAFSIPDAASYALIRGMTHILFSDDTRITSEGETDSG